ncbi:FeoA family protein [Limnohabitans lacus]|jgi:ferrous iron transport protein A|uniref:FeoA family protein n=1 Tax=Limnohabitans lacus TaxID=3045173 RepID=A0ABT6X302_9BURK|nr:FeoA family protein [Limnohabitans sp. HM2-2]MDI9232498.1 FeoA family protein [Limnohabitans sp. HM2-2]
MNLAQAPLSAVLRVARVRVIAGQEAQARQLEEIGFLPGEPVCVMARGLWGGDPLAVRVGLSTFALRREEAACIELEAPDA